MAFTTQHQVDKQRTGLGIWVWVMIGIVVVFLITVVLRLLTPQPKPAETAIITQPPAAIKTDFTDAIYLGTDITIPEKMAIAKTVMTPLSEQSVINNFTSKFFLKPTATSGIWAGELYSMSLDPDYKIITVSQKDIQNFYSKYIEVDQATSITDQLVSDLLPKVELQVQTDSLKFKGVGHEHDENTPLAKAVKVTIPYSYSVNGFPVFIYQQQGYPVEITVDSLDNILKIRTSLPILQIEQTQQADTYSLTEALANINADNAALIGTRVDGFPDYTVSTLKNVKLFRTQLEYRLDTNTSLLYPYYHFSGTAVSSEGVNLNVDIITPAVFITN